MNRTQFKEQIQVLRSLKGKKALDPHGLDWLEEAFETKYPDHLPLPLLFSYSFAYVWAKWEIEGAHVRLNIWFHSKLAYLSEFYNYPKELNLYPIKLNLNEAAGWDWLIGRLSSLHTKQTAEQRKEPK